MKIFYTANYFRILIFFTINSIAMFHNAKAHNKPLLSVRITLSKFVNKHVKENVL